MMSSMNDPKSLGEGVHLAPPAAAPDGASHPRSPSAPDLAERSALSRRGFGRVALLGAAGLWLSVPAAAQARLRARLVASVTEGSLLAEPFLTHAGPRGLEVPGGAIRLEGVLALRGAPHEIVLRPYDSVAMRSRAGDRMLRHVVLPADREVSYGRFHAAWPEGAAGGRGGQLAGRAVRRADVPGVEPLVGLEPRARLA